MTMKLNQGKHVWRVRVSRDEILTADEEGRARGRMYHVHADTLGEAGEKALQLFGDECRDDVGQLAEVVWICELDG